MLDPAGESRSGLFLGGNSNGNNFGTSSLMVGFEMKFAERPDEVCLFVCVCVLAKWATFPCFTEGEFSRQM